MPATIIDGKALALKMRAEVAEEVAAFGEPVCLATILVGEDPASHIYVGSKHKASADAGIVGRDHRFPATTHAQLAVNLVVVPLDRAQFQHQLVGDLLVGESLGQ